MSKGFVQVPPQSTGKKVATEERSEIYYDNLTGSFSIGDVVTGATSGATGTVTGISTDGFGMNAGELYLKEVTGTFSNNENLEVDAVSQALANLPGAGGNEQTNFSVQKVIVTDPNNLERNQSIDRFGATLNTFTEGSPLFGAFGTLKTGEPFTSKFFNFHYDNRTSDFWTDTNGTGSTSHESAGARSLLSIGTANADRVTRTSNWYMPYYPGVGNDIIITAQCGDSGKANVVRRWGQYDDNNGFFFQLNGTTFQVGYRSNVSGSVVDTIINQSDFSEDPLDGTDSIAFQLDVTKGNIYWIDYQWLGTGRVRFGVYEPDGSRLLAHTVENTNTNANWPYTRTATLPFRYETFNTGSSASTSEFRVVCAALRHTSRISPDGVRGATDSGIVSVATADGEVPIISARPKTTFGGVTNRTIFKAKSFNVHNLGSEPVRISIRGCLEASLTGESFASHATNSATEVDTSATAINTAGTTRILDVIVPAGSSRFAQNLSDETGHDWENFLNADGTTQPILCVTAETLTGTTTDVIFAFNWEESRI